MNEARLYELAHEALLTRWGRSYDDVRKYPDCDFFETKQKELWNELLNLEYEMENKGFK